MKIIIVAIGSMGDVYPLIGIGVALKKRGHSIVFLSNSYFEPGVMQGGLDFHSIDSEEEYHRNLEKLAIANQSKLRVLVYENLYLRPMIPVYNYISANYEKGNTMIVSSISSLGARLANEKLGLPMVTINLSPLMFTSSYDPPRMLHQKNPTWVPRWCYVAVFKAIEYLYDRGVGPGLNDFRKEIGLPPQRRILHWILSPEKIIGLFPEWFARPQPDWPAQAELTGFPLFDEGQISDSPMPPEVRKFLDSGTAPIIFTPGSPNKKACSFFLKAMEATAKLGARAIFLTRYREQIPDNLPASIRFFEYVPFSQVFPRAAALVHHGGIGTLAHAMRAGIPQMIVPWGVDQYDHASKIKALGIGDEENINTCTGTTFADKLRVLLDSPEVHDKCAQISRKFKESDPLNDTCRIIEAVGTTLQLK